MRKIDSSITGTPSKIGYLWLTLSLAALAIGFSLYNFFELHKTKIACIDTAKVLSACHNIEELNKKAEEKNKVFHAQLDTLANEFQAAIKAYEKNRSKLSEKEAKLEEEKIRKKQNDYAQFNSANEEALKKDQMKLLEKVLASVNAKIANYAKKKGYSAVFGANSTGAVVYMDDYVDITDDIIEIVNN